MRCDKRQPPFPQTQKGSNEKSTGPENSPTVVPMCLAPPHRSESARGLAQSKTLGDHHCHRRWRQLLDWASPLALSDSPWPCHAKQIQRFSVGKAFTLIELLVVIAVI